MRILLLAPHLTAKSPVPQIAVLLADGLRDLGCSVEIERWGEHKSGESVRAKIIGRTRDILAIRRLLGRSSHDALVVKTSLDWRALVRDVPLLVATRRRTRHIVVQFHGSRSEWLTEPGHYGFKTGSWLLFRFSDRVFVLSNEEAAEIRRFYPRGSFEVVVNPFVPPGGDEFESAQPNRPPTVLFAGRVMAAKGIFEVIEGFATVRSHRLCHLVIAGEGPASPAAIAMSRNLGLADDVTFTGHLDKPELFAEYRAASVFVLPTYHPEGFPTAIAEAMSAGLPIITTRSRGMADHLREPTNALFVQPRSSTEVAAAIERMLTDDSLRATMSEANRRKVAEFTPHLVARRYLSALEAVTAPSADRRTMDAPSRQSSRGRSPG